MVRGGREHVDDAAPAAGLARFVHQGEEAVTQAGQVVEEALRF